jgi:hypothetical protein
VTKEEAQAKLDEACKVLEASFPVYPVVGDNALSATGEEYVEVLSGKVVWDRSPEEMTLFPEDGYHNPTYATPEEAISKWKDAAISTYAYNKKGTLYWRRFPEIDLGDKETTWEGKWKVYSRFLISDEPVIRAARRGLQG